MSNTTKEDDHYNECQHVYPLNDKQPHILHGTNCPCNPVMNGTTIVHNSFDGRELLERIEDSFPK